MSDSNKHKLDKLFQSRFSDDTAAENGWNVPPIELFENAMDVIEPEKKDRKPLWLPILLVGLLIGGLVSMFVYNHMMFDKLDTKIEHLQSQRNQSQNTIKQTLNQNKETYPTINTRNQSTETELSTTKNTEKPYNNNFSNNSQPNVVAKENTNNIESSALISKSTKRTTKSIKEGKVNNKGLSPNGQSDLLSNSKTGEQTSNPSSEQINTKEQSIAAFVQNNLLPEQEEEVEVLLSNKPFENELSIIPSIEMNLLDNELVFPSLLTQVLPIDISQLNTINRFTPYFITGTHFSSFSMNGAPLQNASLTKYDDYCIGSQFGLGLIQQVASKWSLDYSLSYKRLINHSTYNDQTNYKKSNEYINNYGSLMYTDEMTVFSPTGMFVDNVEIPVQVNEIQDGDILQNTTNTTQLFHIINASIGVNYTALKKGKLALILNGGLRINYILNAKQDMDTEVYFNDKFMTGNSYSIQPNFTNNNFFLSGYVGLGINYQITNKFSLTLDNGFERSLNSLNTNQSGNAPSTILNSFNTGLKIGYHF